MSNDLELKLKVSASAADAIKTFGDLKQSLVDTGNKVLEAQTRTAALAKQFNEAKQRADELRIQQVLGKKALEELGQQVSKTSPEYQALAAEIKQIDADLKAAEQATTNSEKAFDAAKRQAGQLKQQMDSMRQSVHQHREALRAQGVDVSQLAQEYTRLQHEAQAAHEAQTQQGRVNAARETLGLTPHADTQARMAEVRNALEELRASGNLTFAEMAQAELRADERTRELAHDLNGVSDSWSSLKADVLEFGAAVAAAYGSVDQAMQFETSFSGVEKVIEASKNELQALSDELLAMTREIPKAATDLADIAESAGSLGIPTGEVGAFTEGVAKMSTAFKMEADATAEYAAGIKNAYGLTVSEVMNLGDAVNTLGNQYAATENDILNVNARSAATAKTFGLTAEQTAALGTTLLSLKNPPEVAATSINSLLGRLQAARVQGKDFQEGLSAIGIDANRLAADITANPQQALDKFLAKLAEIGKSNPTNLAEITNKLVGNGGDSTALQQLVQNLAMYRSATATATDRTKTAGAVEREFAAAMATTEAQVTLAKSAVNEFAIRVGSQLLPAVQGAASGIAVFFQSMADAAKTNPELTKLIAMLGPLIVGAGLLNGIGLRLAVMWATLRTAFIAGGTAAVSLSGGLGGVLGMLLRLIGGPIGLAILAALKLADAWGTLKDKQLQFGDSTVTVSEMVQAAWGLLTRFLSGNLAKMGADLQGWADNAVNLVKSVAGVFNGLGQSIGVALAIFVEEIATSYRHAVSLAQAAAKDIKAAFTRLDFSGRNTAAQWQANEQENKAIEERRGTSPRMDAFLSGYMDVYKGDAISRGATGLSQIIDDAVGIPLKKAGIEFVSIVKDEALKNRTDDTKENGPQSETKKLTSGGSPAPVSTINWDDGANGHKGRTTKEKSPEQITRDEIDALEQGLAARKLAFEKTNLLLEFSKKEEKAYWDEVISGYKGSSSTLAKLKEKSATLDVEIQRDAARQKQDLLESEQQAAANLANDQITAKEAEAQRQFELGAITHAQLLELERQYARESFEVALELAKKKRDLLPIGSKERAQAEAAILQATRDYAEKDKDIAHQQALDKKAQFQAMFAPFEHALDQMTNGILTGQQTVSNAVRNAASSIVVSYASNFLKTRMVSAAHWAWEVAGFAGKEARKKAIEQAGFVWKGLMLAKEKAMQAAHWLWDLLGFGQNEAAKQTVAVASAAVQTGAEVTKDAVTTDSHIAATETKDAVTKTSTLKTVFMAAKQAAAFVYQSVSAIPFVGWAIAPIAAAVAFGAVMAFGSAKGGEYYVDGDDKPYLLHKNESVLPSGVADNFRTVVEIVRQHTGTQSQQTLTGTTLPPASEIGPIVQGLQATGKFSSELRLPQAVTQIAHESQRQAQALAEGARSSQSRRNIQAIIAAQQAAAASSSSARRRDELHIHTVSADELFSKNSRVIVKQLSKEARRFNKGQS